MKIPYAGPYQSLVCNRCSRNVDPDSILAEEAEAYWCDKCVDFVGVTLEKKKGLKVGQPLGTQS